MTLRRRTGRILGWLFLTCVLSALAGAVCTVWKAPSLAAWVGFLALCGGVLLSLRVLGEGLLFGLIVGAVFAVLALGACALVLAGVPQSVASAIGAAAAA